MLIRPWPLPLSGGGLAGCARTCRKRASLDTTAAVRWACIRSRASSTSGSCALEYSVRICTTPPQPRVRGRHIPPAGAARLGYGGVPPSRPGLGPPGWAGPQPNKEARGGGCTAHTSSLSHSTSSRGGQAGRAAHSQWLSLPWRLPGGGPGCAPGRARRPRWWPAGRPPPTRAGSGAAQRWRWAGWPRTRGGCGAPSEPPRQTRGAPPVDSARPRCGPAAWGCSTAAHTAPGGDQDHQWRERHRGTARAGQRRRAHTRAAGTQGALQIHGLAAGRGAPPGEGGVGGRGGCGGALTVSTGPTVRSSRVRCAAW
jgi:hypothetical protein